MSEFDFSSLDFSALEEADLSLGQKGNKFEKINYLGRSKQTWPLEVRLLVNPINSDEKKTHIDTTTHFSNINDAFVSIPCARSVGQICPICDAYWDHQKHSKVLETQGAALETHPKNAEYIKAAALAKIFEPKRMYQTLAVVRGDDKISILELKPSLAKAIFGDSYKKSAGAITDFKSYGVPFLDPREKTGWLSLSKTGTGFQTTYSAKVATSVKIEGRTKSEVLVESDLHPAVLEKFKDLSSLPAVYKIQKDRVWTQEELSAYVASEGTQFPDHVNEYLSKRKGGKPAPSAGSVPDTVESFDLEVPF